MCPAKGLYHYPTKEGSQDPQGTSTPVKNLAIELRRYAIIRNHGVLMLSFEAADN